MPVRTEPITIISVTGLDLGMIASALEYGEDHRADAESRKRAKKLANRMWKLFGESEEDVRMRVKLFPSEYETIMENLEFFIAENQDRKEDEIVGWKETFDVWERFLLEGSHVGYQELQKLRARYGR